MKSGGLPSNPPDFCVRPTWALSKIIRFQQQQIACLQQQQDEALLLLEDSNGKVDGLLHRVEELLLEVAELRKPLEQKDGEQHKQMPRSSNASAFQRCWRTGRAGHA